MALFLGEGQTTKKETLLRRNIDELNLRKRAFYCLSRISWNRARLDYLIKDRLDYRNFSSTTNISITYMFKALGSSDWNSGIQGPETEVKLNFNHKGFFRHINNYNYNIIIRISNTPHSSNFCSKTYDSNLKYEYYSQIQISWLYMKKCMFSISTLL